MPQPGWYPDPADAANNRYWDGRTWTDRVQPKDFPPPPSADRAPQLQDPVFPPAYPQSPGRDAQSPGRDPQPQLLDPYAGYPAAPQQFGGAPAGRIGPDGQVLSGWWRRVGGYMIDSLIVGIPAVVAFVVAAAVVTANGGALFDEDRLQQINDALLAGDTSLTPAEVLDIVEPGFWTVLIVAGAVYLVASLLNGVYLISRSGQTLGDRAINVRKVMPGRTVPTLGVALARWLVPNLLFQLIGSLVPLGFILVYLDYLWPVWDGKSQTLHDKMVRTYVERTDLVGPPVPRR